MSKFAEKLRRGEIPNDEDWNGHLLEGHARSPSQTPDAFANHRTADGRNSYEILADELGAAPGSNLNVVDLACGDGHLIQYLLPKLGPQARVQGIDMSESELAVAKRNQTDRRASFHLGKAQELPFADQSVDLVLSHMAFMLMMPVEPVVEEIARVLKPGGRFSAVVAYRGGQHGFYTEISKTAYGFITSRYPKILEAKLGDPRVFSLDDLPDLFRKDLGFTGTVERSNFQLGYRIPSSGLWDFMENMYTVTVLSPSEREELKTLLLRLGKENEAPDGTVGFEYSMTKLVATKASQA